MDISILGMLIWKSAFHENFSAMFFWSEFEKNTNPISNADENTDFSIYTFPKPDYDLCDRHHLIELQNSDFVSEEHEHFLKLMDDNKITLFPMRDSNLLLDM
jgi:hypothetical protein